MATQPKFLNVTLDLTELRKLKKNLTKLKVYHNEWGWIDKAKYTAMDQHGRKGMYVAQIAFSNEYGDVIQSKDGKSINIPARPYFFQSIPEAVKVNKQGVFDIALELLNNRPWLPTMNLVAENSMKTLYQSIWKQNMTPLSPKTVDIKGNSYQWEDTGVLMGTIRYKTTKAKIKDN